MKKYLLLVFAVALLSNSCDKNSWPVVFKRNITYKVSGTANDYWIQYVDEYGNYKQAGAKDSWTMEFKAKPDKYLYLSARNNTGAGYVKVEVFQGNKVLLSSKSEVAFGVAAVSGFVK
jgi:hypothetical protein